MSSNDTKLDKGGFLLAASYAMCEKVAANGGPFAISFDAVQAAKRPFKHFAVCFFAKIRACIVKDLPNIPILASAFAPLASWQPQILSKKSLPVSFDDTP